MDSQNGFNLSDLPTRKEKPRENWSVDGRQHSADQPNGTTDTLKQTQTNRLDRRRKTLKLPVAIPESDYDFCGRVKVAQVPADDGRPNETGKDGFAFVVTWRRDD